MKKADVALLILVVSIVGLLTYFIAQALLGSPKQLSAEVEVVEPISPDVTNPDKSVFNKDAINPAVRILVGNSSNQQPF